VDAVEAEHAAVVELEEADAAEVVDAVAVEHEAVVVVGVVANDNHATTMVLSAMVCLEAHNAPLASPLA
jgi:hypothetical protein